MTDFLYLVEHEDNSGSSDQAQKELEEQARVILDDKKRRLGQFRLDSELTCPECVSNRRPAKMIAQTYISKGGTVWLVVPPRIGSAGRDKTSKHPSNAGILGGPAMTQCRGCRTYFFIMSNYEGGRPVVVVHRILESKFGAIDETGAPAITHKLSAPEELANALRRVASVQSEDMR